MVLDFHGNSRLVQYNLLTKAAANLVIAPADHLSLTGRIGFG